MSLLELLAVVTIIGIMAAVASARVGRSIFAEYGTGALAREISLDLLTCQRRAISTGDDHFLRFVTSGGEAISYRMMQDTGTGDVDADAVKPISDDITVTIIAPTNDMTFRFEGQADFAYQINIVGINRSYRVSVVPVNGAIQVTETTP
jgi:hypothetical protein